VIVSGKQGSSLTASAPQPIPDSLLTKISGLPGVAAARGQVVDSASIIGRNGKPVRPLGAPTLGLSYLPPPFGGFTFESGAAPTRSTQVVIDAGTASRQHYRVGDIVRIVANGPVRQFEISGIARFAGASNGGEAFATFDLATARDLFDEQGDVDRIYVAASHGTSTSALLGEIEPLLPPQLVARSAGAEVAADVARADDRLSLLTGGLLAFGLIALLVGAVMIFNTYSVTVTRRMREFALLRAVGATRSQVLGAELLEAGAR
jgi:putative ABC transport system permease protein